MFLESAETLLHHGAVRFVASLALAVAVSASLLLAVVLSPRCLVSVGWSSTSTLPRTYADLLPDKNWEDSSEYMVVVPSFQIAALRSDTGQLPLP